MESIFLGQVSPKLSKSTTSSTSSNGKSSAASTSRVQADGFGFIPTTPGHYTRIRARLNSDWVRRANSKPSGDSGSAGNNGSGSGSSQFRDETSKNPRKKHFSNSKQCYNPNSSKKKKKKSRQVTEKRLIQAYQDFVSNMKKKGYEIHFSEDRFRELSTNPQSNVCDEKSIYEAQGGLELEAKGIVKNLRRPNRQIDLDFVGELVATGETLFFDQKGMIDFGTLVDKGIDISNFPSHETVAFNMGKDSVVQKANWAREGVGSMEEIIHFYNFDKIRDKAEIPRLMQAVLNGAEQAGYADGIIFLNYEESKGI